MSKTMDWLLVEIWSRVNDYLRCDYSTKELVLHLKTLIRIAENYDDLQSVGTNKTTTETTTNKWPDNTFACNLCKERGYVSKEEVKLHQILWCKAKGNANYKKGYDDAVRDSMRD